MARTTLLALTLLALAGCEDIGDGSTIESLEVRPRVTESIANGDPASAVGADGTYRIYECIRDQLIVVATFTNGTRADFSFRADWSSSAADVVDVSNGDQDDLMPFVQDGVFQTAPSIGLRPGTLTPKRATATTPPAETVTITARFLNLEASLPVTVGTPAFHIAPAPSDTAVAVPTTWLGVGTRQRFNMIVNRGGHLTLATPANGFGSGTINPLLWRFKTDASVVFEAADEDQAADFDKYLLKDGTASIASINTRSGDVRGTTANALSAGPFPPIQVHTSLCSSAGSVDDSTDPPTFIAGPEFTGGGRPEPEAQFRVAAFAAINPLVLSREPDFNGAGLSNGDMAEHTNQRVTATLGLDTDGDADAEEFQNLSQQSQFDLEPKNLGEDCADTFTCQLNEDLFFFNSSNDLRTTANLDGGTAFAQACFPFCVKTLASLTANPTTPNVGDPVTLTAEAVNFSVPPAGAEYEFDCHEGAEDDVAAGAILSNHLPATDPTATCTYSVPGNYTATVRVTDATGAVPQNAGAVQIRVGGSPSANAPQVTALIASPTSGTAPVLVRFSARASDADAGAGDRVAVYRFDFGDGTPIVSQTSLAIEHVYLSDPASDPKVTVFDLSGRESAPVSTAIEVEGTVPPERFVRSVPASGITGVKGRVPFTAVPAVLTRIDVCVLPDLACMNPPPADADQPAFTYPGLQLEAMGTFTAVDEDGVLLTDADCSAPDAICFAGGAATARQKVTRIVAWDVHPAGEPDEISLIARVRSFTDDLFRAGQVEYLRDVGANTDLSIELIPPVDPFEEDNVVLPDPAATLTVCPSTGCPP